MNLTMKEIQDLAQLERDMDSGKPAFVVEAKRDDGRIEVKKSQARKRDLIAMLHLGKICEAIELVENSTIIEIRTNTSKKRAIRGCDLR